MNYKLVNSNASLTQTEQTETFNLSPTRDALDLRVR